MSNFKNDIKVESEIGKFLDKNFYPTISNGSFVRVTDLELQRKGVDILFINDNREICYIDEKAAIRYFKVHEQKINLNTFAFELINTKSVKIGWFLNDALFTSAYVLIYGEADCNTCFDIKEDNITNMTIYCLGKESLEEYLLNNFGISKETLNLLTNDINSKVKNLKENVKYYIHKDSKGKFFVWSTKCKPGFNLITDEIHFHYSGTISEQPINLLINRDILEKCSFRVAKVKNNQQVNYLKLNLPLS